MGGGVGARAKGKASPGVDGLAGFKFQTSPVIIYSKAAKCAIIFSVAVSRNINLEEKKNRGNRGWIPHIS